MRVPNYNELLDSQYKRMINALIERVVYLGEEVVKEGRDKGSYTDRTTNLRNSIGYVVLHNGKVVKKARISKLNASLVEELIPKYKKGIVLIVVAGMNYAHYVEAKNYDVLTSSELLAEREVPRILKQLGFKL